VLVRVGVSNPHVHFPNVNTIMKKFDKIPRLGKATGILGGGSLWIEEKMDGANFRFSLQDDRIIFGSKNVEYNNDYDVDKTFRHAIEFVRERVSAGMIGLLEYHMDTDLVFFGEAMHKHIMEYDPDIPSFLGFDVYHVEEERFIDPRKAHDSFYFLGLPTVPVIERKLPVEEFSPKTFEFPESNYLDPDSDGPKIEGIIIKNLETGQRAKHRTKEFMEVNSSGTTTIDDGKGIDEKDQVAANYAAKYTTPARVKKTALKMRDEGNEIEMAMMNDLWIRVYEDIVAEEHDEILGERRVIDVGRFQSEVARRTAHILETWLQRMDRNPETDPMEVSA